MKLDKIKFANLVSWISCKFGDKLSTADLEELDNLIDIDTTPFPFTTDAPKIKTAWTKDELRAKISVFNASRLAGTAKDVVKEFIESL